MKKKIATLLLTSLLLGCQKQTVKLSLLLDRDLLIGYTVSKGFNAHHKKRSFLTL